MPYYPSGPKDDPGQKPPARRLVIRRVILGISVLLIAYGGIRLAVYAFDYNSSRRDSQNTRETKQEIEKSIRANQESIPGTETAIGTNVTDQASGTIPVQQPSDPELIPTETPISSDAVQADAEGSENPGLSDKLPPKEYPNGLCVNETIRELRRKTNEDIIGWITMDDLSEPVVLRDNTFFLTHNHLGKKNSNGAIFMDEATNLLTRPYTILLYGHNMKTGAMFGNLRKYEKAAYVAQHRFFRLETLYDDAQYVIFAVCNISVTPGTSQYVSLTDLQSMNRTARREALETLMNRSMHGVVLSVNEEDQLVLLITCVGDDDERLIVAARRLRDTERADSLFMKNP